MHEPQITPRWWTVPPKGQVSYLVGADPELLSIDLDPLPAAAPAVVQFRPAAGRQVGEPITILLEEMDRAAIALYPRWLPGAERIDGPHELGASAVRALAMQVSANSPNFDTPSQGTSLARGSHPAGEIAA
jgi:hypothetical protein